MAQRHMFANRRDQEIYFVDNRRPRRAPACEHRHAKPTTSAVASNRAKTLDWLGPGNRADAIASVSGEPLRPQATCDLSGRRCARSSTVAKASVLRRVASRHGGAQARVAFAGSFVYASRRQNALSNIR